MDYSAILNELNNASLFELHRLKVAIQHQLEDPKRIAAIKNRLKVGQLIYYFDSDENRMIEATIEKFKRTMVLVKNAHDGEYWNIPFYHINIDNAATDIAPRATKKLDRNSLKVGDKVVYKSREGKEVFGEVVKLNPKTAGVRLVSNAEWRVPYSLLTIVIDGELEGDELLIEGEVISTKSS